MKKYRFLIKPLFFICSLLFACWMVIVIEQISPSDFGKYERLFKTKNDAPVAPNVKESTFLKTAEHADQKNDKESIKKICMGYKAGMIDSTELDKELERFFKKP